MRLRFVFCLFCACLPQVGPLLDSGAFVEKSDGGLEDGGPTGGGPSDSGRADGSHLDAGQPDGGTCFDGALNGAETDRDCGGDCPRCLTGSRCRTPLDCETAVCTANTCATPVNVCRANYAGCTSFVDLTMDSTATVRFSAAGDRYVPACVKLRLGQMVTFTGDFQSHPLEQSCGPLADVFSARSGSSRTFIVTAATGIFGYWCSRHGSSTGQGMAGAIEVVP